MVIKFGIISTARIAVPMIEHMHNNKEHTVALAVASRSLEKAQQFASANNVPKAYGSYEDLLNDSEIDAVYVPLPTSMKAEWAIKAAKAKKHVLCDKPIGSAEQARQIIQACQENGVHFMDNTMFVHTDRNAQLKANEQSTVFGGQLKRVHNNLSFHLADKSDIRLNKDLEPQGAIGDLAWYNVRHILWSFNYEKPIKVQAHALFENDVPVRCDGLVWFKGNRIASFDCSFNECARQFAEYVTQNHTITQALFMNDEPSSYTIVDSSVVLGGKTGGAHGETREVKTSYPRITKLLTRFAQDCQNPSAPEARRWGEETVLNLVVLDAILKSALDNGSVVSLE